MDLLAEPVVFKPDRSLLYNHSDVTVVLARQVFMQILINGTAQEVADGVTVGALVSQLMLERRRIAVEVNEELVPRALHEAHVLQPGDHIEIVQAIGGG
jgi:sulfur carrier protein